MKQGWEIKKLGEVVTFQRGLTYSKNDEVELSCNGVLRSNNIDLDTMSLVFDELKYVREDLVITPDKKLSKGSILICMSNGSKQHLGKVAFIDKDYDYAFGGFMGLIKPNDDICAKYIYYTCISSSYKHFLAGVGCGANITNLKFADLAQYTVPVPERAEQERIVGELDCLSVIIAAKRAQLRELDTLAQSIFYTMFGDPITNDKGWQTKALGDVARIINGYAFDSKLFSTDKNDMPLIRIRDIKKGYTETFYKGKYPNTYIIKNGDYIIGMDGEFNIVEWRGGTALLNQRVCKIEFIDDEVIGRYALRFLSIELKRIEDATSFVTVKHLSSKSLISIFIPIPPIDLQQHFAEKIENIERQKELITKSIKETEDLFNSRMDYYFN